VLNGVDKGSLKGMLVLISFHFKSYTIYPVTKKEILKLYFYKQLHVVHYRVELTRARKITVNIDSI